MDMVRMVMDESTGYFFGPAYIKFWVENKKKKFLIWNFV